MNALRRGSLWSRRRTPDWYAAGFYHETVPFTLFPLLRQIETTDAPYGMLKIQNSPPTSFANPVYEPSAPAPTYKVEDVVIRGRTSVSTGGGLSGVKSTYVLPVQGHLLILYFQEASEYVGRSPRSSTSTCSRYV